MLHVDLHLHLLPGVDDGPPDEAASLEHAERMARDGVHEATVTPHVGHPGFPLDVTTIPDRTRALQAAVHAAGIDLYLHPGGEIHPEGATELTAVELHAIAHGPAGARWVLLEVPFAGIDARFLDACRHIRRSALGLVIAHPERAAGFLEGGRELLRPEIDAGAVLQVNVCSLLGRHGPEARRTAGTLIRDGSAYLLASDGHGGTRAHTLASGLSAARRAGVSRLRSRQLTNANPSFLLRHGIPARPVRDDTGAGRSQRRPRITAAGAAARPDRAAAPA
jgi:protein-tyrosine phosphatase